MNTRTKRISAGILLFLLMVMMLVSTSCGKKDVVGEYVGTEGSYLKLNNDGTCIYSEPDSTGTGSGTWYIEDNVLYVYASNIGYTVYADLKNADSGLLLESEESSWIPEFFKKQ